MVVKEISKVFASSQPHCWLHMHVCLCVLHMCERRGCMQLSQNDAVVFVYLSLICVV